MYVCDGVGGWGMMVRIGLNYLPQWLITCDKRGLPYTHLQQDGPDNVSSVSPHECWHRPADD